MCGIAGLFHPGTPKPVEPQRVQRMIDALAHRGPDGEGVWTAPGVGFGHRRLSIIDLAGSPQPMHGTPNGQVGERLTVLFNGCIYNYRELRRELSDWRFHTDGDTEVLLAAWHRWGPAMLDRLDGMFAFAIHDADRRSLFLARDRFGVKPLHYAELSDGSVAFASELKGLLAHPLLRRTPDLSAVEDFLAWGYVPDDNCLVAGVKKLAAGYYLHLERGKPVPAPTCWWRLSFADRATGSLRDLEAELLDRLRAAVRSRLVADVPLGAFLSGGVDSSAVVALMAEASPRAVNTCTIGFDERDHDERGYADLVAARFHTDHHARVVSPDDLALVDTLVHAFDEPFADPSALATYQVSALARETVTVALSGDGADEAFAGYRRQRFHYAEERARALMPSFLRRAAGALGGIYPKADWAPRPLRAKTTLLALAGEGDEAYARAVGVTTPELRARLFSAEARRTLGGYRAEDAWIAAMRAAPKDAGAREPLDRAQWADLTRWLPGGMLTKVDRTSMAVGLEAREPLLDHRLVQFAATLPASRRIRGGQGKWLLKKTLEPFLPREIMYRPKMGFTTPVAAWFRGRLADEAAALARSKTLDETGWFDLAPLATLAEDHRAGRADHGRTLWQFLMLENSLKRLF
ncbi:XrtA/PEP-CTERM system amidotransferase [Sphingomonas sp.]|uniref:XrtA/PEP-CTERM system amidotransferase n=1 Tax=Sphingomonas sp. TaxID=28214 RepID=UPI003CC68FF8